MKATIRVPLDPYAYIEIHKNDMGIGAGDLIAMYRDLVKEFKGGDGLDKVAFDKFIDNMLLEIPNDINEYTSMNIEQKEIVQAIKRSKARLYRRATKNDHELQRRHS